MAKPAIRLPDNVKVEQLNAKISAEFEAGLKYRKRREPEFNENYTLYRNKTKINRLTQRQPMNIPLTKETIQTLGAKTNSPIYTVFENRDGDLDAEIALQALYRTASSKDLLNLKCRVDKKNAYLYGRGHMGLEVDPNWQYITRFTVEDVYDIVIDPSVSPYDIETARFLHRDNVFKPLHEVLRNERFDKEAREKVRLDYQGNRRNVNNDSNYARKKERMQEMGLLDLEQISGLDKMVQLQYCHTYVWDSKNKEYIKYYVVRADGKHILRAAPHMEVYGVDFYLMETWATDLETTDYWSDSIADIVRVPNKAINTWISQYMENRTLRGFGMNFYDSTIEGFHPQKFDPRPFGWYPLPGKPKDVYQHVDIPQLEGTLQDIQFLINIAERASATGAIEKGAVEDVKRTLGEIEIAVNNALERTNDLAPLYNAAYQRLIEKWYAVTIANMGENGITLYKKSPDGQLIPRTIKREDIETANGYEITIIDKAQSVVEKTDEIVKIRAAREAFPNNKAMRKAEQRRLMQLLDLTPQEAEEIEQEEVENAEKQLEMVGSQQGLPPEAGAVPAQPGAPAQLTALTANAQ